MAQPPNSDGENPAIDWSTVHADVAKHIFTQGDTYLKAQMQLALDADKRALGLAGFFTTFSTALTTVCLSYFNKTDDLNILISGLIGASLAFISAVLSFYSARPLPIKVPGNHPASYWPLVNEPVSELYGQEAEKYQENINKNQRFLIKNAKYVRWAIRIFVSIPIVLGVTYYLQFSSLHLEQLRASACSASALRHVLACE